MKVRELIEKLQEQDPEMEVKRKNKCMSYGIDFEDVDDVSHHAETYSLAGTTQPFVVIW